MEMKKGKHASRTWLIVAVILGKARFVISKAIIIYKPHDSTGAILAISLLVVLALAINLGVTVANSRSDVCMTKEYVELSSQISQYMDTSVDPCEDFYRFTCEGFREEAIIPFGKFSRRYSHSLWWLWVFSYMFSILYNIELFFSFTISQ